MRTLNVRLAAILLAILVVFGAGVFGVHAYMISKNKKIFADEARKAQDEMAAAKRKGQGDRTAAEKDKDYARAGQCFQEAIKYWNWYLRLAPEDGQARQEYGMMLAGEALDPRTQSMGLLNTACRVLEEILREDQSSTATEARRQLVKMLIMPQVHRSTDAQQHLTVLLEQSPKDPQLLQWRAIGLWQAGKETAARETLEKAIGYDVQFHKGQFEAYALLAQLLRSPHFAKPKDIQEADQWMLKLVENNPKSAEAHRYRARYLLGTGHGEEALKEGTKAVELAPDDAETIVLAAQCNLSQRKRDQARKLAEHGVEVHPDTPMLYLILSNVIQSEEPKLAESADAKTRAQQVAAARAKQLEESLKVLEQGLSANAHNPELLYNAAGILIDSRKLDDAQKLVDEMQAGGGGRRDRVDYLNGRILFEKHHWREASERLQKAREAVGAVQPALASQIDLMLGDCYGYLGEPEERLTIIRRARNTDPSSVRARVSLLEATRQAGNIDEALGLLEELIKSGRSSPLAMIDYADLRRQKMLRLDPSQRHWADVERVLDVAAKSLPDNPRISLLRAQVLADQDRFADAEKVLREALRKNPKDVNLCLNLAGLAERQKQWAQAEKLLSEARDNDPQQLVYRFGLAALAERREDWAQAEKILDDCQSQLHDSVSLRLARMQYLVARYRGKAGPYLQKTAEHTESFSAADRLQLLSGLLNNALRINDSKLVDKLSKEIAVQMPNDMRIRQMTFERALAAGDTKAADQALEEYRNAAGQKNYYWYYGRALLLCQRARSDKNPAATLDTALELLAKARQLRKDWPRLSVAEGEVYRIQGKPDQAIRSYREAWKMGERNALLIETAFQLFFQTRQFAEANQWIDQLVGERANIPLHLIEMGVAAALESGQFGRALELLKKIDPAAIANSPRDQLWRGQVLSTLARQAVYEKRDKDAEEFFRDAEQALRRAVELDPAKIDIRLTLVQFLLGRGRDAQAEAAANAVQDPGLNVPAGDREMVLGSYYQMVGKSQPAEKHFLLALAAAPQSMLVIRALAEFDMSIGKLVAAEGLAQSVLEGKVPGRPEDAAWARRQLADINITRGGYQNLKKAQALIDQNLSSPQKAPLDERLQALLYLQDPDPQQRDKAVAILENLTARKLITPQDRFTLVKIYLSRGDWQKASSHLRALVAENAKDTRYLTVYVASSIEHGELSNAEVYLERLEAIVPNSVIPTELRAQLLAAQNRPEEGYKLLVDFLDKPHAQPEDRSQRTYYVFQALAGLAKRLGSKPEQKDIAEKCRKKAGDFRDAYVKEHPEAELQMAAQMIIEGKVDEGLDMLNSCLETSQAGDVARVFDHILMEAKLGPEHLKAFNDIVLRAVQVFHEPIPLVMVQGSLRSMQLRFADAEERYRRVLEKNPKYYAALNNLAELLGLQKIKLDEALQDVDQAIELRGPEGAIIDTRASVYLAMGRTDDAIRDLEKALKDREEPARLFHLAQAYRADKQDERAKATFDKALKKGLTKDSLHPLEATAFDEMRQFARQR